MRVYRVRAKGAERRRSIALAWPAGAERTRAAERLAGSGHEIHLFELGESVARLRGLEIDAVVVRIGASPWLGLAVVEALCRAGRAVIAVAPRGRSWLWDEARRLGVARVIDETVCNSAVPALIDALEPRGTRLERFRGG